MRWFDDHITRIQPNQEKTLQQSNQHLMHLVIHIVQTQVWNKYETC